jgi:acyl-CoA thioesterase-1
MWHRVTFPFVALAALLSFIACSSDEEGKGTSATGGAGAAAATGGASTGGASPTGGAVTGGVPTGGVASGGVQSGGMPTGGVATGGVATGGVATGGVATGGVPTGGVPTGGLASGGATRGGASTGGASSAGTGGLSSGGAPSGGGPNGGEASGGEPSGGAGGSGGQGGAPGGGAGGTAGTGGSGGNPDGGTGGMTVPPRLCILPLGDSITQSNNTHLSYRYPLWEDLVEAGYEFDFIGSMNTNYGGTPTYPNQDFDRDHEGHWGWRVDQINAEIQGWLGGYTPDVVLMHLGTNDAFQNQSTDSTIDELTDLIGMLRADNERVVILLAKLIPSTNSQSNLDALNGRFDALAASLTSATSPVVVVDQASGFNASADTFDGIHPNEGGEQKMATRWLAALEANWPSEGGECEK